MSSEVDKFISERYIIKRRVGKGAYGIVWKAIDRQTKEIVAVKKIFDAFRNQTDAQRTFREIMFLREFSGHPNIIKLHDVHAASNNSDIYLVFEYMETDLHNVIKSGDILRDIHKRYIMYQLLKATRYIHAGHVIHRDQKPSNILLDANCRCKVADFGLARSITQLESLGVGDPTLTDYVATRWYRAPEILIASKRYTQGIDMWSLGCILGEMLLGKPLFPGSSTVNQIERIMTSIPEPTAEDVASVCSGYGSALLQRSPPSARRPLAHLLKDAEPDGVDLVCKLLVFDPRKRLTALQALQHPYILRHQSRFNPESAEPTRWGAPIVDEVQLSVDEYRDQLYRLAHNGLHSIETPMSLRNCNDQSHHLSGGCCPDHCPPPPNPRKAIRPPAQTCPMEREPSKAPAKAKEPTRPAKDRQPMSEPARQCCYSDNQMLRENVGRGMGGGEQYRVPSKRNPANERRERLARHAPQKTKSDTWVAVGRTASTFAAKPPVSNVIQQRSGDTVKAPHPRPAACRSKSICREVPDVGSYNQTHGVISQSALNELRAVAGRGSQGW